MDKQIILEVLEDVYPGEVALAPHLAERAATHAVEGSEPEIATADHGDTMVTAEMMELLIQASVFVAAIVSTAKDLKDLLTSSEKKEQLVTLVIEKETKLASLSEEDIDTLLAALERRLTRGE